jgi:hypothetical protein
VNNATMLNEKEMQRGKGSNKRNPNTSNASSSPINHEDNTNEDHPIIGILSVYLEREL